MEWYFGLMQSLAAPLTLPAGVDSVVSFWLKPPAGAVDNVSEPFPVVAPSDETLVRMRVSAGLSFRSTGAAQSFENDDFAFGIIRWSDVDDTAPNILDTPFPIESAAADWLWHWYVPVLAIGGNAGPIQIETNLRGPDSLTDVRSQRKLSAFEGLLGVFEYRNVGVVSVDVTISLFARMLFKLP